MPGGKECHAISSHIPENNGQIEIRAGDTITSVTHLGNGWTIGRNLTRKTVGVFPTSCISLQLTPPNRKTELTDCIASVIGEIPEPQVGPPGGKNRIPMSDMQDVPLTPPPEFQSDYEETDVTDGNSSQNSTLTRGAKSLYANVQPFQTKPDNAKRNQQEAGSSDYHGISDDSDLFDYDAACMPRKGTSGKKPQIAVKPNAGQNRFPEMRRQQRQNSISSQSSLDLTLERRRCNRLSCPVDVHVTGASSADNDSEKGSCNTLADSTYSQVCRSVPSLVSQNSEEQKEEPPSPRPSCSFTDVNTVSTNGIQSSRQSTHKVGPTIPPTRALDMDWLENRQNELRSQANSAQRREKKSNIKRRNGKLEPPLFVQLPNRNQTCGTNAFVHTAGINKRGLNPRHNMEQVDCGTGNGDYSQNGQLYQDYRTLQCPDPETCGSECDGNGSFDCSQGSQVGTDTCSSRPNGSSNVPAPPLPPQVQPPAATRTSTGLIFSVISALIIGIFVFLWMRYSLHYGFLVAISVAGGIALILCISFVASRVCRCVAALMIPSLATTKGRITFLCLITGFLLGGPISNIYGNLVVVSRSLSCSTEQVYNQSQLLVHPFHSLVSRLNHTSHQLHQAARNVSLTLVPLHGGLDNVESSIQLAQHELQNSKQVCQHLMENAFNECNQGIIKAAEFCGHVITGMKDVYHQAKQILENFNPETWKASPRPLFASRTKRQAPSHIRPELASELPSRWDMCKPLDHVSVCVNLSKTEELCKPHGWAEQAIKEAINSTRKAMHNLRNTLRFTVHARNFLENQANASKTSMWVRKQALQSFMTHTEYFDLTVSIVRKIIPAVLFILVGVSYLYLKRYIAKDGFDNVYITPQFKALDRKRVETGNPGLLPFKKYERNQLIDTTTSELSPLEEGLYKIGLCVLVLHLLLAMICYLFDFLLYWILDQVRQQAQYTQDVASIQSMQRGAAEDSLMAKLVESFFNAFHSGGAFKYAIDAKLCLPQPVQPSVWILLVIFFMYAFLILTVLLKSYLFRCRRGVAARFYRERERVRIMQLYYKLYQRRSKLYEIETLQAKRKYKERIALEKMGIQHKVVSTLPPFKMFMYKPSRCFICSCPEEQSFHECPTENCPGVYCAECFKTVGRKCPLCTTETDQLRDNSDAEENTPMVNGFSKFYV